MCPYGYIHILEYILYGSILYRYIDIWINLDMYYLRYLNMMVTGFHEPKE